MTPETTSSIDSLRERVAVVTGATSGVGNAIALALARKGMQLCLVGRDPDRLAQIAEEVGRYSFVRPFHADLALESELHALVCRLQSVGRVDVLIHSAGVIRQSTMQDAQIEDFDLQYCINVRTAYLLTKGLLPQLLATRGQIVFLNSTAGLTVNRSHIGQYAATKHALKGVADSLRAEVNPKGVRVLSVFLGRTATPMQESIHRWEQKSYKPNELIQPEDVASVVVSALTLPNTAEVTDIVLRPMKPAA